jgi:hypothetical protein
MTGEEIEAAMRTLGLEGEECCHCFGPSPAKPDGYVCELHEKLYEVARSLVSQAYEEAALIAEREPRVWNVSAPSPQERVACTIRALKDSLVRESVEVKG